MEGQCQQMDPENSKSTYIKGVLGTTWHWLGTRLRNAPGWPFDFDALEPFCLAAVQEIRLVAISAEYLLAHISDVFPTPMIPMTFLDKQFVTALDGSKCQVRSTLQARLSTFSRWPPTIPS
jgi:hypothetical protein